MNKFEQRQAMKQLAIAKQGLEYIRLSTNILSNKNTSDLAKQIRISQLQLIMQCEDIHIQNSPTKWFHTDRPSIDRRRQKRFFSKMHGRMLRSMSVDTKFNINDQYGKRVSVDMASGKDHSAMNYIRENEDGSFTVDIEAGGLF